MYKNFNLTDKEREQIMEQHAAYGYRRPINEMETKSRLVGQAATFYADPNEALAAFKAGKSNPQAKGAILGTITAIDKVENDFVSFYVKLTGGVHDTRSGLGKLLGNKGSVVTYSRENGNFTLAAADTDSDGKIYYSESVKRILDKEFFTTKLAYNNPQQQPGGNQQANMA